MKEKKKVLIDDPQFLTRQGLVALVDSLGDFEVVEPTSGSYDLVKNIEQVCPDVVVVGMQQEDVKAIKMIEAATEASEASFLVITGTSKKRVVQKLLNFGVKGVLTKNCSEEEIINGLMFVAKNNRFYCNAILEIVMSQEESGDCDPTILSDREYQVLEFITRGLKTNEIAQELYLSVHTVNSHRKNILKKLNVKTPAELIVYALESGLVAAR